MDGLQGTDTGTATYASVGAAAGAAVGSYDINATGFTFMSGAASNYHLDLKTAPKGLNVIYRWDGFLQPIKDTAHDLGPMSEFLRSANLGACNANAVQEDALTDQASVVPQYTWDGTRWTSA